MLRHLSIRDFVIVAELDLEFDRGFTVFSGETGAGKSILIDALALALGARADADVVRTGTSRADITAEFGGKMYPAKDARMEPRHFQQFYPQWQEFAQYIDPAFSSAFWQRVTRLG